jgi:GT2 family glycosyltransferase
MLSTSWRSIPESLRSQLLVGSVGGPHLLKLAGGALTLATEPPGTVNSDLFRLGREMLLAAWEADFFNGTLAEQLLNFHARDPWLDPHLEQVLKALQAAWRQPGDLRQFERIVNRNEPDAVREYVGQQVAREPDNAFWLSQVLAVGLREGDPDWLSDHIRGASGTALHPLYQYAQGMLAFFDSRYEEAAEFFESAVAGPETRWLATLEQQGHALYRAGERDKGLELFRRVVTARPWHMNLALHVHDLLQGLDHPAEKRLSGRTAVLLYSWNKADDLDRCLEALSHSVGDWDLIAALDNGSEDRTQEVLTAWQGKLGTDKLVTEQLRVNVGAPAARNWLMRLPQVAETEYAVYLDDDAIVPADWLRWFPPAMAGYPEAGAWGCRIVDDFAPLLVQSVDLHVRLAEESDEPLEKKFDPSLTEADPFDISELHGMVPDLGQFNYVRPCVSVTGCCHLFRTPELLVGKGFSLNLSPSQFDDLEYDLRHAAQGGHACYQGHLAVRHHNRSGKAARLSRAQTGNALGNKYKLRHLYDAERIRAMHRAQLAILEKDLLFKANTLDNFLTQGGD